MCEAESMEQTPNLNWITEVCSLIKLSLTLQESEAPPPPPPPPAPPAAPPAAPKAEDKSKPEPEPPQSSTQRPVSSDPQEDKARLRVQKNYIY